MEQQLERVDLWLKTIYGNQPVPEYEVNAETVGLLYKLAECSEARDRDMALLIEDTKERAAECEAKAEYLQGLLTQQPSVFLSSLSSECTSCLDILVSSAMVLETNDTSLTSLCSAINDRTLELYEVESENREKEWELRKMKNKLTAVLMMEKKLQEDLNKWEEILKVRKAKCEIQSKNSIFLKDKAKDIKIRIKDAEEKIIATGLDQSLTHESLMKLSEKLAGLRKENASVKKQLQSYLDLAPNPCLAQVKIEEVKRELNVLEEEISKEVNKMLDELPSSRKHYFT